MSKELEALLRIEDTIDVGLKNQVYFKEVGVMVNLDKGALLNDVNFIREALKRNEPMKVDLASHPYWVNYFYECPKCKELGVKDFHNYCSMCGQKLDWSDEK